jgi:hypothetical protein
VAGEDGVHARVELAVDGAEGEARVVVCRVDDGIEDVRERVGEGQGGLDGGGLPLCVIWAVGGSLRAVAALRGDTLVGAEAVDTIGGPGGHAQGRAPAEHAERWRDAEEEDREEETRGSSMAIMYSL